MSLTCRWEILLISLWIQVSCVPGIHCDDGTFNHLSREDVLLLKDEQNPKCFTRTEKDFTCFFETADNRTYDFLHDLPGKKRCDLSVQTTKEGTFLHICSFPGMYVFSYVELHLEVVEHDTNTSLYNRTVSVEDHYLLDRPFNVSLHQNGRAGQLQVSWHAKVPKYWDEYMMYRIRYSSKGLGELTKEAKEGEIDSLLPGEEVEVQVTVKCALNPNAGHWSSWSHPVRAVVPQSADDISLACYTSDLQNISCQWNGSRYSEEFKLFYKTGRSEVRSWTEWAECFADRNLTELCHFRGEESRKMRVKLSSTSAPSSRTFYSQEFTLNKSIKTAPPCHVRAVLKKDKLCLKWEAPLPSLLAHLQYEVSYKIRGGEGWMMVSRQGPETSTCLEVPAGSHYRVKLRAKPDGSIYSGHWSDWSDVLTGDTPADIGTLLLLCIPILMMMIVVTLIFLFTRYLSELKQYFWPPVPDLDKVLQGFLKEINGSRWNPPITAKQFSEETASSVVEIMSDGFTSPEKSSEGSTQLLSPERHSCSGEQVDGSHGTQAFPDYVTLNKDSVFLCPKGNKYIYEEVGEKEGVSEELLQTCHTSCSDGSDCIPPYLSGDFLNQSYLPLAEPADKFDCNVSVTRGPGNLYTNFPCG
ncbi:thrombopoietin receptor [Centropristis striata]|uniref:thrombopoietin receptor n=1 Tax=Centropristis striata TaxID=184440 RepID=UPI0027E019AC|nr:thrombopoietin receptor [Centropristis striata]